MISFLLKFKFVRAVQYFELIRLCPVERETFLFSGCSYIDLVQRGINSLKNRFHV